MKNFTTLSAIAMALTFSVVCVPAAFAADPPTGDTAMKSDQPVTDTWITTKVKTDLATTDGVKSADISVKTVDGTVFLIGVLASDAAVKKAVAVTKSIKGVKHVDSAGLKVK